MAEIKKGQIWECRENPISDGYDNHKVVVSGITNESIYFIYDDWFEDWCREDKFRATFTKTDGFIDLVKILGKEGQ